MGGEARRRALARAGVPDDGFRVRIRETSKQRKARERRSPVFAGLLIPSAKGGRPLRKETIDMLHRSMREANRQAALGGEKKAEPIVIETTEEDDDAQPDAAEDSGKAQAAAGTAGAG
jgi:hypothetical protein